MNRHLAIYMCLNAVNKVFCGLKYMNTKLIVLFLFINILVFTSCQNSLAISEEKSKVDSLILMIDNKEVVVGFVIAVFDFSTKDGPELSW